jgi:hypothetical protein
MPPDHGRRFDEYQGIEDVRPHSVKPHPEQTVGEEESRAAATLPPENNNLMSQGDELELQRCAAADAERREARVDRIVIMHPDSMAVVP